MESNSTNQILLAYPDSNDEIRSTVVEGTIYFSLFDVVKLLAAQNVKLSKEKKPDTFGLVHSLVDDVLDKDESRQINNDVFITEPGLFRIILRDSSAACKKFQRWVLHEVLPTIQKYGTYPAPSLDTQDSDIKRTVKLLLSEIEAREKLEKETRDRFNIHEKALNDLGNRLDKISESKVTTDDFLSVEDYCKTNNLNYSESQKQLLQGWCIKICAEENEPTKSKRVEGIKTPLFSLYVLDSAKAEISKES